MAVLHTGRLIEGHPRTDPWNRFCHFIPYVEVEMKFSPEQVGRCDFDGDLGCPSKFVSCFTNHHFSRQQNVDYIKK